MGTTWSLIVGNFPPKPKWSVAKVPDLTGKIAIVTGGNTGIGKETVKVLLQKNATVYIGARSEAKAIEAINELLTQTGKTAKFLKLNLASLESIKSATEEYQRKEQQLHILINNGGVMKPPIDQLTEDGYDLQLGTNCLGHFYLTKLLLPTLTATAKTEVSGKVRVVNVSSLGHLTGSLDFAWFRDGPARRKQGSLALYPHSKFINVVFATELARRYGDQGIVSTSLNPGTVYSGLYQNQPGFAQWIASMVFYPVAMGAITSLRAATDPEGAEWNGRYLDAWARLGTPKAESQDPVLGRQLWEYFEEQVKNI
ncbi:NAD(P)-binding protein [Mycena floridula]|nr:NAD(P)-binding protein [Mycena floridula]